MANWNLPTVNDIWSDIVAFFKNRDVDLAMGMDPANTSVTNPQANFIRWNSANKYWEKFNGTTWNALESDYAINIQFSRILSKPTTLAGYGITDAQPLDADLTALAALASTAGMLSRTGANAFAVRTLTGTANRITISNGTGAGGNPTFDIGTDVVTLTASQVLTNKTLTAPAISSPSFSGTATGLTVANPANTDQTLTDQATINWNMDSGGIATVTLGGNRTMAAPTNLKKGTYVLHVIQPASGGPWSITWNAVFKWANGTAPVLSTAANKRDILTFVSDGTNLYGTAVTGF